MVADRDLSKLATSAGLVLVGGALASVAKLVERVLVARSLSMEAYGEVSIGIAIMSVGTTLGLAGFQQGVPRYMSRFDDEADVRGAWLTGLLVAGAGSLLLAGVLLAVGDAVVALLFEGETAGTLLALFALAVPFSAGFRVGVGAVRGLENTIYKTYGKDLFYPFVRILVLAVLLWLGLDVLAAGLAYLLATAAGFVAIHLLLWRLLPLRGEFDLHAGEMVRFSAPLLLSTVVGLMLSRTDTLMLGYFRSSTEVAVYAAAYPLATGMLVVLSAFGFMYLPVASRLDVDEGRQAVDAAYKVTTKWIYLATFPVFLTLVAFPGDVLSVVFGAGYASGALALQILAVGFFANAAGGRNRETLAAVGHTEYVLLTNGVALAVNVLLNLAVIPAYGYLGASVASAVSFVTMNAVVVAILVRKLDVSPFSRWATRTFVVVPLVLVPPALGASAYLSLSAVTLPIFAVGAAVATVYTAALTGCLQPADRVLLDLLEEWTGLRMPLVGRFLPEGEAADPERAGQ